MARWASSIAPPGVPKHRLDRDDPTRISIRDADVTTAHHRLGARDHSREVGSDQEDREHGRRARDYCCVLLASKASPDKRSKGTVAGEARRADPNRRSRHQHGDYTATCTERFDGIKDGDGGTHER
jgi:hypothetical protein